MARTSSVVLARLREQALAGDDGFDRLLPEWAQRVSRGNWTPVAVAQRAAALLVGGLGDEARVLDVGAGVGKLCIVGALSTGARFHGVEQRPRFVAAARQVAARLGAEGVRFTVGDAGALDFGGYHAIYLFNPFAEYLGPLLEPFDDDCCMDVRLGRRYVAHVQAQLEWAAPGARVVTYNGFGGELPAGWRLDHAEPADNDKLELWIKA